MISPIYSKAIVSGCSTRGLTLSGLSNVTGLDESSLEAIVKGEGSFEDRHLELIESATRLTCGQLALLSESAPDDSICAVIDTWASVADLNRERHREEATAVVAGPRNGARTQRT